MILKINDYSKQIAEQVKSKGFHTGWDNLPEKLLLVHSEISEAVEAHRNKNIPGFKEEIADTFIRLMDICGALDIDVESEICRKMAINISREYKHGKEY